MEASEIEAMEGPPERKAIQILEEASMVAEIHLVAKSNVKDLQKTVACTNVMKTFQEAEYAPLRKVEYVAHALETSGVEEVASNVES